MINKLLKNLPLLFAQNFAKLLKNSGLLENKTKFCCALFIQFDCKETLIL